MNVSPISFKNAVKIYDTYENAKKVSKIVNSNSEDNVDRVLKSVFPDRRYGKAMVYQNNKGNIYILSGSDAVCAQSALDAMSAIKKHSDSFSKDKRAISVSEAEQKEKYYQKVDSFISQNPIRKLWVDWDKSNTKIKSFSLMG